MIGDPEKSTEALRTSKSDGTAQGASAVSAIPVKWGFVGPRHADCARSFEIRSTCRVSVMASPLSVPPAGKSVTSSSFRIGHLKRLGCSRSDHVFQYIDRHAKKTMLLTEVIPGKDIRLSRSEIPRSKPSGFDSVIVAQYLEISSFTIVPSAGPSHQPI